MWRVERAGKGILFVVVRAVRIECAAWADGRWSLLEGCQRPLDAPAAVGEPADAPASALRELAPLLRQWREAAAARGERLKELRVVVADCWLSAASVPWSADLRRPRDAAAFARNQLESAGFTLAVDDEIRFDDAPYGQPRFAVAYPRPLLSALQGLAGELGVRLGSVVPLGAAAWLAAGGHPARRPDCIAIVDDGLLSFVHGAGRAGDITVRGRRAPQETDGASLDTVQAQWQRMRLRDLQLAVVDRLRVLDLGMTDATKTASAADGERIELPPPAEGSSLTPALRLALRLRSSALAVDPCSGRASASPLHWAMAAVAALVAAVLVLQAWQAGQQVHAERLQLAAAQAAKRPAADAPRWSRDDEARARAVNVAVRQLNLPISALLRALQPPADIRVAVLSVDLLAGASGAAQEASGVRIMAEARTGEAMARYVGFVSERKPFVGAYLVRHEIVETSPERPYRFTVEATWSD